MYQEKNSPQALRTMILAGQNETVRKNASQEVFLATVGLNGCVALILHDDNGNASLTHIDTNTNLAFLEKEVALMKGPIKVELIKKTESGILDQRVIAALNQSSESKRFVSIPNKARESKEGTIVFNFTKSQAQVFLFQDFTEIAMPNCTPSPSNRLKQLNYKVETCTNQDPAKFQLRVYTRQLNQALSANKTAFPLVVFNDSGWQETEVTLEKDTAAYLQNPKAGLPSFFEPGHLASLNYVLPKYRRLVQYLESQPAAANPNKSNSD